MAVAGMQWGSMWARHFGGSHSHSVTVQVNNSNIVADTVLAQTWAAGDSHHSSKAQIVQIVSNSGVENFPTYPMDHTCPTNAFRINTTSITFYVQVYQAHALSRWMIYHWA